MKCLLKFMFNEQPFLIRALLMIVFLSAAVVAGDYFWRIVSSIFVSWEPSSFRFSVCV